MSESEEVPLIFVRRSSGLVRSIPAWSTIWFPIMTSYTPWFFVWPSIMSFLYPGCNALQAVLIGGLAITFTSISMMYLSASMPRTGAQYITLSRTLHPIFGIWNSITQLVMQPLIAGIIGWFGATFIATSVTIMGQILHNPGLVSAGLFLNSFHMLIAVALIANIIAGIICVRGVHILAWVMAISAVISTIGVLLMIGLLALNPSPQVMWDTIWGAGAYKEIIDVAMKNGYATTPTTWAGTSIALLAVTGFLYPNNIMPLSGEVAKPKLSFALSFIGGGLVLTALICGLTAALTSSFGDFPSMYTYVVWGGHADQLVINPGLEPSLLLFACSLTTNPAILFITGPIIAVMAGIINIPTGYYWMTRAFFAMSFDRFAPDFFSKVHPRWHTPYLGELTMLVLSLICTVLVAFSPVAASIGFFINVGLQMMFWTIACAMFPYFRPDIFRLGYTSAIGKYPLASIAGVLGTLIAFYILFAGLGAQDPISLMINILLLPVAMAYFIYYLQKNKDRGIDVEKIFLTVPPG